MREKMPSRDFSTLLSSLNQRLRIIGIGYRLLRYLTGANGEDVRDALSIHADAVHGVGLVHRRAIVGDDDELYASRKLGQQVCEALHVGFVECRVDLVE